MPSKSPAQKRLMQAVAHSPKLAKKVGIPQSVGKDFAAADKMKDGGLYANIHAKQKRIAAGSGEKMRKVGSEGAPAKNAFKQAAKTAKLKEGGNVSLTVGRGEKLPTKQGAGLTAKGRAKYNRETGGNLKAPQPGGGPRKKSFCARMSGMPGPMKDENGKPTRKAAALNRWKC